MNASNTVRFVNAAALSLALAAPAVAQAEQQLPGSSIVIDVATRLLVSDVNGDGRADLVYRDLNPEDGAVRLSRPDGTFGPSTTIAGAHTPTAIADFTEDGIVDVLAFKIDTRVTPGFGDGSFGPPILTTALKPSSTDPVAVGDVDLDGHLDFAWHFGGASALYVQLGHGDGTFTAAPQVELVNAVIQAYGLADLDGDGDVDAYTAGHDGFNTVVARCSNDGTGQLAAAETSSWPDWWADQLATHDFDGDGIMDFVASGGPGAQGQAVTLLRGGSTSVSLEQTIELGAQEWGNDTGPESWIGDIDGDGATDLLVASNSEAIPGGQTWLLKGTGGFAFTAPLMSGTDFSAPELFPNSSFFHFADLDADGRLDVLAWTQTQAGPLVTAALEVAYGNGDGTFDVSDSVETGVADADVVAADLDADGITDLLSSSTVGAPQLLAHLGLGDGSFASAQQASPTSFGARVLAADLTGDGYADAFTFSPDAGSHGELLVGQGNGFFGPASAVSIDPVRDAAIGDFDLDGQLDLACSQPALQLVSLWTSAGGALVSTGSLVVSSDAGGVAAADVTGDGHDDVLVTHELGASVLVFPSEGGLGSLPPIWLATNPFPHAVLGIDVDSDGSLDVAAACGSTGYQAADRAVSVHRSAGAGSFGDLETWPADVAAGQMATGDFDRDGLPDIALVTLDAPFLQEWPGDLQELRVEILHGAAGGLPGQRVGIRSGGMPSGLAIADFDGNGHPDLAVSLLDATHVRVHLSRAATWSTLGEALPSSSGMPLLSGSGEPVPDQLTTVTASLVPEPSLGYLVVSFEAAFTSFAGGVLVPSPDAVLSIAPDVPLSARWPKGIPAGTPVYLQAWFKSLATGEFSATNALVTIAH